MIHSKQNSRRQKARQLQLPAYDHELGTHHLPKSHPDKRAVVLIYVQLAVHLRTLTFSVGCCWSVWQILCSVLYKCRAAARTDVCTGTM